MTHALLLAVAFPALLAPLLAAWRPIAAVARAIAPWAALPTLVLAVLPVPYPEVPLSWLLLGARVGLDPVGRVFLIVAASLWTAAGVYASDYVHDRYRQFLVFFLLTMAGNLGVIVAADGATFYAFFALMTFAAYGLIVHRGDAEAGRAGRSYLILAVAGEAFLLAGLVMAAQAAESIDLGALRAGVAASERVGTITLCLLVGFAIKAGAVPLHVWLPLAHPVAPTPASAVLSGSMIKAGLLGWIRFLPIGEAALPGWGAFVIGAGMVAAFFGVLVGLLQTDPKTVLAYSSISQMGVMNVGIGIALAAPAHATAAVAAVGLYAAHHGLAKGALFLGTGVAGAGGSRPVIRRLVLAGLSLSGIALAGAPLTSGYAAKSALKYLLPHSPGAWPGWLDALLPLSAAATTLLVLRFLLLVAGQPERGAGDDLSARLWTPWVALIGASVLGFAAAPALLPTWDGSVVPDVGSVVRDLAPILGGVLAFGALARLWPVWRGGLAGPAIAPGDLLNPLESALASVPHPHRAVEVVRHGGLVPGIARRWYRLYSESDPGDRLVRLEIRLTRWSSAVLLLALFLVATLLLMVRGSS